MVGHLASVRTADHYHFFASVWCFFRGTGVRVLTTHLEKHKLDLLTMHSWLCQPHQCPLRRQRHIQPLPSLGLGWSVGFSPTTEELSNHGGPMILEVPWKHRLTSRIDDPVAEGILVDPNGSWSNPRSDPSGPWFELKLSPGVDQGYRWGLTVWGYRTSKDTITNPLMAYEWYSNPVQLGGDEPSPVANLDLVLWHEKLDG